MHLLRPRDVCNHHRGHIAYMRWMRRSSTCMLQEISESSSNRIVQRTSWSKERMLGLRNRSIFILLSVLFQLLMSADPRGRPDAHKHTHTHTRRTHACTRKHVGCVPFRRVSSPLVTPLGMNGWMERWMDGWIREWMDATEREGGEPASVSCLPTDGSTGGRMAFSLLSLSLSGSLTPTFFALSLSLSLSLSKFQHEPSHCNY